MNSSKRETNFTDFCERLKLFMKKQITLTKVDKRRLYNIDRQISKGKYCNNKKCMLETIGIDFSKKICLGNIQECTFKLLCTKIQNSNTDPNYSLGKKRDIV